MARDIDRKLRLTAALLGTVTRKDLAAAFRRVNPATPFEVERAHKWLQGRARPRERQVYEDWAKLLDLNRSGQWIAECDAEAFLDAICARHQHHRDALRRSADSSRPLASQPERGLALAGTFACYSHAWSPYFRGRLIRGELSITTAAGPHRPLATYAEVLPTGRLQLEGPVTIGKHAMNLDLRERAGEARFAFRLFPPTPPVSILGGLMCGATIIGPDSQPSVTRIAIVRLPAASERLRAADAYLPAQGSICDDLATLGLSVADPVAVDRYLVAFLAGTSGGVEQVSLAAYRTLVELFDRMWLASAASPAC